MTIRRNLGLAAALLAVSLTAAGCIHVPNPFKSKGGDHGDGKHHKYTGKGERIPLAEFEQKLTPSEALKGQDFYLPPPAPIADWPLPGGTPEQSVEHVDAGKSFDIAWRTGFGRASSRAWHVTAPPIAADGKVFVMDGGAEVSAHDAGSGRDIWRTNVAVMTRRDREGFGGGIAYDAGKLFVTTGFRAVVALDAATGKVLWRRPVDAPIHAAPTVSGGRVFVESTDDNFMTFDEATGAPGWTYQAIAEPARILEATSPAVSGDAVVASFASGELVALQADNGNTLWTAVLSKSNRNSALSEIRDIPGRPVVYKGDVFAVSHSGVFSSIELRTGNEHWNLPVTSVSSPWPVGDVVYVSDTAGEIICVSRDNGQVYWVTDMNKNVKKRKLRALWSGPILASNRLVIVSDKGEIAALNPKTGAVEKTIKTGQDALMTPIAAGPYLYVATEAAELIAIR
jgi:outer membrane protein assembly factor BamB